MACGTAVVVSPMDGIADIVATAEAGRILADVTPSGLALVIRELLAPPPSRAATRLYAEQFDWQSTTDGQLRCSTNLGTALESPARSHARSLMPQDTLVDLAITGDAVRPGALAYR